MNTWPANAVQDLNQAEVNDGLAGGLTITSDIGYNPNNFNLLLLLSSKSIQRFGLWRPS